MTVSGAPFIEPLMSTLRIIEPHLLASCTRTLRKGIETGASAAMIMTR